MLTTFKNLYHNIRYKHRTIGCSVCVLELCYDRIGTRMNKGLLWITHELPFDYVDLNGSDAYALLMHFAHYGNPDDLTPEKVQTFVQHVQGYRCKVCSDA